MDTIICPNCKIEMIKRKSKYRDSYWWGCRNYPKCTMTFAENLDGTIMSIPAPREVKYLRRKAHLLAKKIWKSREETYKWLGENTRSNHFGLMDGEEILITLKKMIELYEQKKV